MSAGFDPYYKWLGIPPKDQPPNHYRLLGLELFEPDLDVIDAAANRLMVYLQDQSTGAEVRHAQKLLNEISAARRVLLTAAKRQAYDAELRSRQPKSPPAAAPTAKPAAAPPRVAPPAPPHPAPPHPAPPPPTATVSIAVSGNSATDSAARGHAGQKPRSRSADAKSRQTVLWIGGAGAVAIVFALLFLLIASSSNQPPKKSRATARNHRGGANAAGNPRPYSNPSWEPPAAEVTPREFPSLESAAVNLPPADPPPLAEPTPADPPPAKKPAAKKSPGAAKPAATNNSTNTPPAPNPAPSPAAEKPSPAPKPSATEVDLAQVWPATLDLPRYPAAGQVVDGSFSPLGPPLELGGPEDCDLRLVKVENAAIRSWFEMISEAPAEPRSWRVEMVDHDSRVPIARYRWQRPAGEANAAIWQLGFAWLPGKDSGGADRLRNIPLRIRVGGSAKTCPQRSCEIVPPLALMGPGQPTFHRSTFPVLPTDFPLRFQVLGVAGLSSAVPMQPPIEFGKNHSFAIPGETDIVARIYASRLSGNQLLIEAKVYAGQSVTAKNQLTAEKIDKSVAETNANLKLNDPENKPFRSDEMKAAAKAEFAKNAAVVQDQIASMQRVKTTCAAARVQFAIYFDVGEHRVYLLKTDGG